MFHIETLLHNIFIKRCTKFINVNFEQIQKLFLHLFSDGLEAGKK